MVEYIYPAVFHPNEDGSFTITYPDLPGCISEGKSGENALHMAQSALMQWIGYLMDKKLEIPLAGNLNDIEAAPGEFVHLICANFKDEL